MQLTNEQEKIYSRISELRQVILKNNLNIRDLTEQLISTLPFKEGDIVLNQRNEHLLVRKIEPYDNGTVSHKHRYFGKIIVFFNKINKDGQPSKGDIWEWITSEDIKNIKLPSKKGELVRI